MRKRAKMRSGVDKRLIPFGIKQHRWAYFTGDLVLWEPLRLSICSYGLSSSILGGIAGQPEYRWRASAATFIYSNTVIRFLYYSLNILQACPSSPLFILPGSTIHHNS